MPESLTDQFISDLYTSLIHLSGSELGTGLNKIFDGAGNSTGLALSGNRVVINNYIYPEGGLDTIEWLDAFFPIGCIQLTFDNINPQTRIAGTTWEHVAEGRFIVGVGECFADRNNERVSFAPGDPTEEGSADYDNAVAEDLPTAGNDLGEFSVTLVTEDMPSHNHETNINSVNVQVDSPVGSGSVWEATGLSRAVDSSDRFKAEVSARNRLGAAVGWNYFFVDGYDPATTIPQYEAFLFALDLNFQRGSAANYSEAEKNKYTSTAPLEGLEWKEMVGLWNGETRFVPRHVSRSTADSAAPGLPEIPRDQGPMDWVLSQMLPGTDLPLGQLAASATNSAFLVANQELNTVIGGPNQAILQHTDLQAFRTSTRVGLGYGHNNIPPSYGAYVWKRTA